MAFIYAKKDATTGDLYYAGLSRVEMKNHLTFLLIADINRLVLWPLTKADTPDLAAIGFFYLPLQPH